MRALRRLGTASLVAAVLLIGPGGAGSPLRTGSAVASAPNRAAVVVDTGSEVKTACVEFAESSITGVEALQRAGFEPVARGYGGIGVAVCSLCGKGCPADGSCLTCLSPDYWSYHRAPSGQGAFAYSQVGPGATEVRNGDVEGWRWGTGGAPAFLSFQSVCSKTVATTAPGTGGGGAGSSGSSGSSGSAGGVPARSSAGTKSGGSGSAGSGGSSDTGGSDPVPADAGAVPGQERSPDQVDGGGQSTADDTSAGTGSGDDRDPETRSLSSGATDDGSDSAVGPWGWVVLGAVMAGIGAVAGAQRLRRQAASGES